MIAPPMLFILQIVLLALATSIRPTSLAAVYALLSNGAPRRLMTVYVVSGLAFTLVFGVLVVWVFDGIDFGAGKDHTKGVAQIVAGVLAILFALVVRSGRLHGVNTDDAPDFRAQWERLLEGKLTPRTAAIAGPLTHMPGLFYLLALNLIVTDQPRVPEGLASVLLYNAVWFALPLTALAICVVEPAAARQVVRAVERWTLQNTRTIVWIASLLVGVLLIVKGALVV
jgi:hypothetical protein